MDQKVKTGPVMEQRWETIRLPGWPEFHQQHRESIIAILSQMVMSQIASQKATQEGSHEPE